MEFFNYDFYANCFDILIGVMCTLLSSFNKVLHINVN